ncbi:MAG: hemerythrin domain-containing protein, partial [Coriobacteriia bacterium]
MPETVIEVLKREHQEITRLLKRAEMDPRQFSRLAQEVAAHFQTEEDVLYPSLRNDRRLHSTILEGSAEHYFVDLIVREIERNKTGTDEWHARLKVMRENLERHMREEEDRLFPRAERLLESDRFIEMAGGHTTGERVLVAAV